MRLALENSGQFFFHSEMGNSVELRLHCWSDCARFGPERRFPIRLWMDDEDKRNISPEHMR